MLSVSIESLIMNDHGVGHIMIRKQERKNYGNSFHSIKSKKVIWKYVPYSLDVHAYILCGILDIRCSVLRIFS